MIVLKSHYILMKKRADRLSIIVLVLAFVVLYYPVFYTDYLYTDEAVQLWYYGKQDFPMFVHQGRYITEKLMLWLFGSLHSIIQVKWVRIFSFAGWMICIPVWYYLLKEVLLKERLPVAMAFFSTLYLICMPSVSISVVWASCLELFLANTAGLLSGYCLYRAIKRENSHVKISKGWAFLSVLFGVLSLFTYQNGFGCFFLPFIIHALASKRITRPIWLGIAAYLLISVLYFLLFKLELQAAGSTASGRTSLYIAPLRKLFFFFVRPMSTGFHFTFLFNELDLWGYIIYAGLFGSWLLSYWQRHKEVPVKKRLFQLGVLMAVLVLIYLPSLLVRENYASNRTLLALNIAVFLMVAETIFYYVKGVNTQRMVVAALCVLFIANAWYNVRYLFFKPVRHEYAQLRTYLERNFTPGIQNVYFIRPEENFFVKQYHITRSWDEFGVPSTFFDWVPEFFCRQIIYEKTKDRQLAEKVVIKEWLGEKAFRDSKAVILPNTLLIPAEEIIKRKK
jgi:hypothetical protein